MKRRERALLNALPARASQARCFWSKKNKLSAISPDIFILSSSSSSSLIRSEALGGLDSPSHPPANERLHADEQVGRRGATTARRRWRTGRCEGDVEGSGGRGGGGHVEVMGSVGEKAE